MLGEFPRLVQKLLTIPRNGNKRKTTEKKHGGKNHGMNTGYTRYSEKFIFS